MREQWRRGKRKPTSTLMRMNERITVNHPNAVQPKPKNLAGGQGSKPQPKNGKSSNKRDKTIKKQNSRVGFPRQNQNKNMVQELGSLITSPASGPMAERGV